MRCNFQIVYGSKTAFNYLSNSTDRKVVLSDRIRLCVLGAGRHVCEIFNIFSILDPRAHNLLACGRNRELWEQPFQACAIDADCVKPDGQNSVISFVISKWLLPELSFSDHWSRGTKTLA